MTPPRPAAIFVNQGASSAGSWRVRRAIELTRAALDADLVPIASRDPLELVAWFDAHLDDYRTVIIAGGDGTLSLAYNLAAERDVTLGYLPAGFGNATAHLLRLPRDPVELAAVLAIGEERPVDLVAAGGRLALFAGVGWDATVAERYEATRVRRFRGWATAVAGSLPDLLRRPTVSVEADGRQIHHGPMELLVIGTTPWFGRGLLVNPGAAPDLGRLTLRVYPGPAPRLAAEALRWFARREPSAPAVTAQEVVVRRLDDGELPVQADGDVIGRRGEWLFGVRPGAVRLIGRW